MKIFYTILVASAQYHGTEALTYSSDRQLPLRSIVLVPLQKQAVLGIVTGVSVKPRFATKDILDAYNVPPLPIHLIKLAEWIGSYYPAPLGMIVQQIVPAFLSAKLITENVCIATDIPITADSLPRLTAEQSTALQIMKNTNTYLIHGDTGSGKTRVYIEMVTLAIISGRSAIVLTPEIGLTSQLAASFRAIFGSRVVLVHSQLTPKARQLTWLRIVTSKIPLIVLGPRSALFSPLPNIGIIVVDESHEPAYKQEQAPHYHAVRVASQLAHLHKASLILGSATPSITDYYIAEQKHKPIIRMIQQATSGNDVATGRMSFPESRLHSTSDHHAPLKGSARGTSQPRGSENNTQPVSMEVVTTVVDLKDRSQFTRSQYLSTNLLLAIDTSLLRGEQSLLYLNRRGTARVIRCNTCGWQAVCLHCDLPLTYHHDLHILQCHTCGFRTSTPTSCPDCGNTDVVFKVVGTKAIEEEVKRLYPHARVKRFDTDNSTAERFDKHYDAIKAGEVDILVGTQLLAKGLDLPKLTTLGVVIADTSLTFPDYSAEERTYQLLAQVIGRVGRGHNRLSGSQERIIVQSYAPDRPVITAALTHDWNTYYNTELRERQLFYFPPFCYLLKLSCRRATSKSAEKTAEQFYTVLKTLKLPITIEGPMPSFHAKVGDKFEWQLVIKSKQRTALLQVVSNLPKSGWSYDIDPVNLL